MNTTQLSTAIKWWTQRGSFDLNHLQKVLEAKGKLFTEQSSSIKTINELKHGSNETNRR